MRVMMGVVRIPISRPIPSPVVSLAILKKSCFSSLLLKREANLSLTVDLILCFFIHKIYLLPAPFPFEDYVADRFPEILPIGAKRIF